MDLSQLSRRDFCASATSFVAGAGSLGGLFAQDTPSKPFSLDPGKTQQPNEGPTDYKVHLKPFGTIPAVMIFVDFSDAPQQERTSNLFEALARHSVRWYREVSYQRLTLEIVPVHKWYRMPKASKDYGIARGMTFEKHRAYISDAVMLAPDIDFSKYQIVYVVASKNAALPTSPAFHAYPGAGVKVKDHEIRHAATLCEDIRVPRTNYGAHVLIHETGHIFGLPDLYEWKAPVLNDAIRVVGGWDIMSFNTPGAHFLAWHKWKLGWLDANQIRVLEGTRTEAKLTPVEVPGGLKAVIVPTGPSTAYVVEARQPVNSYNRDYGLVDSGVLVYTVDATVTNGSMPIHLKPARRGSDERSIDRCGPLYDGAFDSGRGELAVFNDAAAGLKVEVVGKTRNDYTVRVSKATP